MKILRLDLLAFGPFADAPPLHLGDGLHLIHGPNEAGKSSTLRAIRNLLFGFPARTGDDHRHAYADLRIGATLRNAAGAELSFLRRKRNTQSLRTADDASGLPDDALRPFLDGIDAKRFNDLFSLDHAELVDGGRAIATGGGDLGSILFAAGTGLARLHAVRKALDEEMAALFLRQGKNPRINQGLADWKAARDLARDRSTPTESWLEAEAQYLRADADHKRAADECRRLAAEKRRLESLRGALPLLARRDQAARALAEIGAVPILAEGFSERRRQATSAREAGLKAGRDSGLEIARFDAELDELGPPDPALAEADAIRDLRDALPLYLQAEADRPQAADRLARLEDEAQALRAGLGLDGRADPSRVSPDRAGLIQELVQERGRIEAQVEQAAKKLAALAPADLAGLPPDASARADALEKAVDRARKLGDPEDDLATARADLAVAEAQAEIDLKGLAPWSGTLDDLVGMPLPATAHLDQFEARFDRADEAIARVEADRAREAEALRTLEREAAAEDARAETAPPSESELVARRAARGEAWLRIRRAWAEGEPAGSGPSIDLAAGFEATILAADDHADRLRREADRVAERSQRDLRRIGLSIRIDELAAEAARLRDDRAAIAREWAALWAPAGVDPLPPRAMKDWIAQKRAELIRQAKGLQKLRGEVEKAARRLAEARDELGRGLAGLGCPDADPAETLFARIDRARAAIDRVAGASALARARDEREAAEAAQADWSRRWAEAVAPLGLGSGISTTRAVGHIQRINDLADRAQEIRDQRDAIAAIDRDRARFEAAATGPAGRIAPELAGRRAEDAARALLERLDRAQAAEARRADRLRLKAAQEARRDEARREVDRADAMLATLVREAGVDSPDGLIAAEAASDEARRRRDQLADLDDQLADLAGLGGVDRLRDEVQEELAGDTPIDDRLADLSDRLAAEECRRDDLARDLGRAAERFDKIDGGSAAADAQQVAEEKAAHLSEDIARYVRLRLASAALESAIEQHRKKHQGPVLGRAEELFARLTLGSFPRLRAEVDEKGTSLLYGQRGDEKLVGVDGMSEGTADQLYLALRLASLSAHIDHHEPMPLIVDDILVNFDNARSAAALRALADLSARTQVLFFTHHEHLVDLARATLPGDVLTVHRLDRTISAPPEAPAAAPASTPSASARGGKRKKAVQASLLGDD
ncbi:AAA family ATPase [Tundrisphaera sp. TA3]|uniref:AAA family ATPase n=1 Tax=Tundrisphaera sp. TA3 TaxID=3435775 RepID=UPI003EB8091E